MEEEKIPSAWSSEEENHPYLKEVFAYKIDYFYGDIARANKANPFRDTIALCVRKKNKIIEGNK